MRVLIGYDDSECARAALRDLRRAGLPDDVQALVLSALDAWLPPEGETVDEVLPRFAEVRAEIRDALRLQRERAARAANELRAAFPRWTVHAESCADSPAWAIVKRAEGLEGGVLGGAADLVVVGSQGKRGLQRFFLGSVSSSVLANAACSVRIAREKEKPAAGAAPPALVVGVDGSPDALAAVEAVAARAWPDGTRVLVAAFEQGAQLGMQAAARWESFPRASDVRPSARAWAEGSAEEAADVLRRRGGLAVEVAVDPGDPKDGLVELAHGWVEGGADCIFVGARGLRRVERLLLGSVSTSVATHAPCSVEVVRPQHRKPAS